MIGLNLFGGGLAETVENIQDREGGGEAGERTLEEDEPQEVTLKDIHDLLIEYLSNAESACAASRSRTETLG